MQGQAEKENMGIIHTALLLQTLNLQLFPPAYAITNAIPNSAPKTVAVTQSALFCEHTATLSRFCLSFEHSAPARNTKNHHELVSFSRFQQKKWITREIYCLIRAIIQIFAFYGTSLSKKRCGIGRLFEFEGRSL